MDFAVETGESEVIDGFAKGRNARVFFGVKDDDEAVLFRFSGRRDIDAHREIAGNKVAEFFAIKISVELKHGPIESENMDRFFRLGEIKDFFVGE